MQSYHTNMPCEIENVYPGPGYPALYTNQSSMPSHPMSVSREMQNSYPGPMYVGGYSTQPPPPPYPPPPYAPGPHDGRPSAPPLAYAVPYDGPYATHAMRPYQSNMPGGMQNVRHNPGYSALGSVYTVPDLKTVWIFGSSFLVILFWVYVFSS